MAKKRYIDTKFWTDDYILTLDPIEKLLYLYFFTNPFTNICGIYELSFLHVALETGIEEKMIGKILQRFTKDDKIYYHKGYILVKNFVKNQKLNPSVIKGIEISLRELPTEILEHFQTVCDSLLDPATYLNLNLNLNLNSNLKERDFGKQNPTTDILKRQAQEIQGEFIKTAKKELGKAPLYNKKGHIVIRRLLESKKFTVEDLKSVMKDWFEEPKDDEDLIQITQCFSDNHINRWQINK